MEVSISKDVRSMSDALTEITEDHSGNLNFPRDGKVLIPYSPKHKDLFNTEEVVQIQHFLEHFSVPELAPTENGTHFLVVINYFETQIYKTVQRDSVPVSIMPYDPGGTRQHLHNLHDHINGQRKRKSYYETIAQNLRDAEQILIFGSAMNYLVDELNQNHPDIAKRIVGAIAVNERLSEDQLLAQARAFYQAND
jgi:hypothetical protein